MSWLEVKLADCVDLLAGFAFKSESFSEDPADIALVKGENVSQGSILWDISKRWDRKDWDRLDKFQLRTGDVVVAMDRPWVPAGLKWAFIRSSDPRALLVQRCARLRTNTKNLDQEYLRFVIGGQQFEDYVKPITTGVNIPHISGRQILDFTFRLPPRPTQRRIAGILSAYDELIANNQRRIALLEQMARALYREWFVYFRAPGVVMNEGKELPEGWEVSSLGSVLVNTRHAAKPGSDLFDRRYVPIDCLPSKSLALMETRPIEEAQSSLQLFEEKDILFGAMRAYFHKVVPAPFAGVTRTTCFVLRPRQPEWWAYSVMRASDADTVAYAASHSQGATIPYAVWDGVLAEMAIVLPPHDLIARYNERVGPMLVRIMMAHDIISNLRRTRDLLLPRLMSGRVEVKS